ncbi:MAG: PHP domain-containing protein [Thermofilaceae archaeon]|nr:PHP domain-containing protein [Thermofilaceae archaeon]MCX8180384.1 PHP domain-containing protein [Thermofilaceae archaeon]MDW8003919.1 PHP domain-containing protein [Thermofilaceae archaeon]
MIPKLDLHLHSQFSPCAEDVNIIDDARVALEHGLRIIAITDHGKVSRPSWLDSYFSELNRAKSIFGDRMIILSGMEVDIVDRGSLAVSSEILKSLDVVVASLHEIPSNADAVGYWRRSLLKVLSSGYVTLLGHPTDIGWKDLKIPKEYALEVLDEARSNNVALELNFHHRDPKQWFLRLGIEMGVTIVATSDAHNLREIGNLDWHEKQVRMVGFDPRDVNWIPYERFI